MRESLWYGNLENENVRMRKTDYIIRYGFAAVFALLLASCVKDELYNTPHPDRGVVSVSVDYPQGAEEDDYTVEVDGKPLDEGDNASNPLTPGEHTVLVYNTPEGFTVTDDIAYVERVDGTRALTDLIDPLPETLYSGTKTVTVVADDTLHLDLSVLTLTLTFTDGVTQTVESDLTEVLAKFNDGTEAVTITGDLETPVKTGFGCHIEGWHVLGGYEVDAE